MADNEKLEPALRLAVFPILVLVFAFQAYACRALFADGVNYFYGILINVDFPWWDYQRTVNHLLTMWPAIAAIKLGLRDMTVLRYLYSSWMLFCPVLMWGAALWSVRRDVLFWPMVMLLCFVYFGTNIFAVGEYNLCFGLAAYCFTGLARPLPQGLFQRSSLLIAALLMPMQYSAALFLAGLFLLLVIVKPEAEWQGATRTYRAALIAALLITIVSALWEILLPRDAKQFAAARHTYALWHDRQFWIVLVYSLFVSTLFVVTKSWGRYCVGAVCLVLWGALIFDTSKVIPVLHHGVRAYVSVLFAVLMAGLWLARRFAYPRVKALPMLPPAGFVFILLAALSFFDMQQSLAFRNYLQRVQDIVNSRSGLVSYEMSGLMLSPYNERFNWDWTLPLLSLVLRDNEEGALIMPFKKYKGYLPVDPRESVPDLTRFYHRTTS